MISSSKYFNVVYEFRFLARKRGIVLTEGNNVEVVLGNRISVFIKENQRAIFIKLETQVKKNKC